MLLNPNAPEVAKVVVEEGVKIVTTGAGNPGKFMEMWKQAGVTVIPVVASVAMAKMMERAGQMPWSQRGWSPADTLVLRPR